MSKQKSSDLPENIILYFKILLYIFELYFTHRGI